jgi:hypothetical protein
VLAGPGINRPDLRLARFTRAVCAGDARDRGIVGRLLGTQSARYLSERRGALNSVFAAVIITVALYMLARNLLPS